MTKYLVSNERRFSSLASTAVLVAAGMVLSWVCLSTEAQERTGKSESMQVLVPAGTPNDLERAFWLCDYAGTTGSVDTGTAIACSTITEELKNRNFNGEFEAMLAWWRENKAAQHQTLEAGRRAVTGTGTAARTMPREKGV